MSSDKRLKLSISGKAQKVDYRDYVEHVQTFTDFHDERDGGGRDGNVCSDIDQPETRPFVGFEDGELDKINIGEFFDNLSSDEDYDNAVHWKEDHLNEGQGRVRKKDKKFLKQRANGKRPNVDIKHLNEYHEYKKAAAMPINEETIQKIKRDFEMVRSIRPWLKRQQQPTTTTTTTTTNVEEDTNKGGNTTQNTVHNKTAAGVTNLYF